MLRLLSSSQLCPQLKQPKSQQPAQPQNKSGWAGDLSKRLVCWAVCLWTNECHVGLGVGGMTVMPSSHWKFPALGFYICAAAAAQQSLMKGNLPLAVCASPSAGTLPLVAWLSPASPLGERSVLRAEWGKRPELSIAVLQKPGSSSPQSCRAEGNVENCLAFSGKTK